MSRDAIEFLKAAIRNPLNVSTVFPTSAALADRMLDWAEISGCQSVVELGAGTGAITKQVAKRLPPSTSYLGIELDPRLVAFLKQNHPNLHFECGLAENLPVWVQPESTDLVISSLPWTMFPTETQMKTIDATVRSLKPGGTFITYICSNAILYPQARGFVAMLKDKFGEVRRSPLEWRNLPPVFIFKAIKAKSAKPD